MTRKNVIPILTGLTLAWAANAPAASVVFDFNSDPSLSGLLTNYGNAVWIPAGGVGAATNANDGYLQVTANIGSQRSAIVFADFDAGSVVAAFTFEADVKIGNGTTPPADGFSVNYVRANDPVLTDAAGGGDPSADANIWATGPNCEANLPEEGTQTGISIGFDAWPSGGTAPYCNEADQSIGPDIAAVDVRVDGTLVLQFPTPTYNGSCTDPTSLQTGPTDASGTPDGLCWAHVKVVLDTNAMLSVYWKGSEILSNYQTTYFPSAGRLVFAGRTGGSYQFQLIDNIHITTIPAALALVGKPSGLPDGFSIEITDSGNSVVDITKPVTAQLNGTSVTPTSVTKNGALTTIVYHGYPLLLAPGSTNAVTVTAKDTSNNSITATDNFVQPAYATLPAADAVTGVDTTKPGFRILPWQSGAEPNNVYWMQEQLVGLHGTNNADLTTATDQGYIDFTKIINFNINPASAGGTDAGNFMATNGYPDSLFPGIPGANGLNGSSALEVLTFLQFKQPGVYQMGVNSDDGFAVTEGKNPRDRFALLLGQYDGGRGPSDSLFYIAVTNAGFYPFRLIWENGNGELPGNGAALEWFLVNTNGVKILVNDPSTTNNTGVAAYYAGPALPAFVSHINAYIGTTRALPYRVLAQLTDSGSTTVNGNSIKLGVDGSTTPAATVSKSGAVTTATLDISNQLLPSGPHTGNLVWADSAGTTHTNNWAFTVESYMVADASQSVAPTAVDTSKPGFSVHVAQIDPNLVEPGANDGIATQIDYANGVLAGSPYPWYSTNTVDVSTPPSVASNLWYWTDPIDFNISGSGGDFTFDAAMPGIPGVTGRNDNFASGFDGWVVFPKAGYYRMSVSSDDGFRVSEGNGLLRQVLHVKGVKVDRDVAAVVSETRFGNGGFGAPPPVVPITAPAFMVTSNNYVPGQSLNLTGKVAVVDINLYGANEPTLAWVAQTNGALAIVEINAPGNGLPYVMTGKAPGPITIPAVNVSGFGGERDTWVTNTDLTVTLGASQNQIWGSADYGKSMGRIDLPVVINAPGAYPVHLTYMQGGGGAGLEWQTYQYDGIVLDYTSLVVINNTNDPVSLVAYRAVTGSTIVPTISIGKQGNSYVITYTGVLRSSTTVTGTYQPVAGASSPYTIPASAGPNTFYRTSQN